MTLARSDGTAEPAAETTAPETSRALGK
jgi:hypothetical protein